MSTRSSPKWARRDFLRWAGAAGAACGMGRLSAGAASEDPPLDAGGEIIPGFEAPPDLARQPADREASGSRKIRVGIAGYGLCRFGAQFGFQDHPNVEVVAVTDLIPRRCAELAMACRCDITYPSCEAMLEDDRIEAVFIATDAPSHARLAVAALDHGKHVASAVPAVYGSLEDAERLFAAVKRSGLKYMMFETSCFHDDLYAWRQRYLAGLLGRIVYSEGEYFHHFPRPLGGYNPETGKVDVNGWRKGLPPQWYPTHATAYHVGVTGGWFTEVSCMGQPSLLPHLQPENNAYRNPFGTEIALFRTNDGGMSRMAVSWDIPVSGGERGRVYGQYYKQGEVDTERPPLPPGVRGGGHGGSHGHLMHEFVEAILQDRDPLVDVCRALNMTVAGIVAHESALRDGERLKVPFYRF